jgi:hypothetical protein
MTAPVLKPQVPKVDTFKGNPVIILNPEDRWTFSFGINKARLILQNLDAIKAFVEANETKETTGSEE